MKAKLSARFILGLLTLSGAICSAQTYSIDWHTIDGGGGTSTGGGYSLSGTIGQPDAGSMSGGGYTLGGGFWGLDVPIAIFDNTSGSVNGGFGVTATTWLASKFLLKSQSYRLDSLSLLLNSQDSNGSAGPPCTVLLHIYSSDPVSGKPAADTGVVMNLSGLTNPIILVNGQQLVKWIPATPFTLVTNTAYWAVLSAEDGKRMAQLASFTMPTGDAGTFGQTRSTDSGATWPTPSLGDNFKMLIQGTAIPALPAVMIIATERVGVDLRLSFTSVVGASYDLQTRTNLSSGTWVSVPGTLTPGNGTTVQVTLTNAFNQPQQFFRIHATP